MPTVLEMQRDLDQKRGELARIFEEYKTDQKDEGGNVVFKAGIPIDEIKKRNDELTELGKTLDEAKEMDEIYQKSIRDIQESRKANRQFEFSGNDKGENEPSNEGKSLGQLFAESREYKERKEKDTRNPFHTELKGVKVTEVFRNLETKANFTTGAGFAPFVPRIPRVIMSAQRQPVVADLIPQDDTTASAIKYMEETTFTNAAAAVAEGGTKPESALQFTERTVPMTKIATSLPVTDEQLMDVPQIRAVIDNRLTLMLRLEEDRELLLGNPGGANAAEMTGFLNKSGVLNTAKGADDVFTAVYKAITAVRDTTGFADPSGIVFNPNNWLTIRTTKDGMGRFILGDPDQEGPERLWGLPVVKTVAMTAGTSLLGDFQMFSHISRREGIRIDVGYVNDQFIKNLQTILIEERLALEIYRAAAFSTVTGLP
ncbi:MAG: phage major capsid protein [Actinomycetota bacterium]|nr:phage major capsid protein [Actinomycetota bacterium]